MMFACAGDGDDQDQGPLQGQGGGTAAVHQEENQRYQVHCKLSAVISRSLWKLSAHDMFTVSYQPMTSRPL